MPPDAGEPGATDEDDTSGDVDSGRSDAPTVPAPAPCDKPGKGDGNGTPGNGKGKGDENGKGCR